MKNSRAIFYVVLAAILLLSVYFIFESRKWTEKHAAVENIVTSESNSALVSQSAQKTNASKVQIPLGKIISDITTSSNRIVVAEKDGVQRTAIIPPTLANALTDDQILYSLFHTNAPPKKSGPGLNQHLTFYGMTVDDQTNTLAGTTINGSILVVDGQNQSQQVPVQTTSDGDGRFQFDMDFGQLITLTVSKGTNYISPPPRWFKYGSAGYGPSDSEIISYPDINNPVFFILTKKQESEKLIELHKGLTAPNTAEPVRIDLTTGEIVPAGGDLIVSITCPEPFKAGVHIPWKLVLQATDGGFVATGDQRLEYMLEAPESGYSDIVIDHPADDPNWASQYDGIMYLKSRNGQIYGKMTFNMNCQWDERGMAFGFHSFVNTNGSRNLQNTSQ